MDSKGQACEAEKVWVTFEMHGQLVNKEGYGNMIVIEETIVRLLVRMILKGNFKHPNCGKGTFRHHWVKIEH